MQLVIINKLIKNRSFNLGRLRESLPGILKAQELNTKKLLSNWIALRKHLGFNRTIFKLKEGCLIKVGAELSGNIIKISSKTAEEVQEKFANATLQECEEVSNLALKHWRLMKRRNVLNLALNAFFILAIYESFGIYLEFPDARQDQEQKIHKMLNVPVFVSCVINANKRYWIVKLKTAEEVEIVEENNMELEDAY